MGVDMRLIVLLVSVLLVTPTYAETVSGESGGVIDEKVIKAIKRVCLRVQIASDIRSSTPQGILKEEVAKFHNISKTSPQIEKNTEEFWNKYHNDFICDIGEIGPEGRKKLHIVKMALQYSMFNNFFKEFLLAKDVENKYIVRYNVNSVQWVDGRPETVVDYIDSILNNPTVHAYYNTKKIKFIRKILVKKYNAKTAKQLLAEKG